MNRINSSTISSQNKIKKKQHSTLGGSGISKNNQMNLINEARLKHLEEENEELKKKISEMVRLI